MNNPFQYQNDLSQLNSQFDDIHQYYANKMKSAKSDSLIKKGQDLAKQSQDLAQAGRKATSAVGEIVGAGAAKSLITGVVKPGVQALTKGVQNIASRLGGGGVERIAPNKVVPIEEEAKTEGGESKGDDGDGIAEDEAADADDAADAGADAGGDAGADAAADAAADVAADAGADALADVGADALADAGAGAADAVATGAGAVFGADWWNPVGWLAGLVAAGAGIASAVEAGEAGSAGAVAGKTAANQKPSYSPPPSFAGRYIVPVNNALTAF